MNFITLHEAQILHKQESKPKSHRGEKIAAGGGAFIGGTLGGGLGVRRGQERANKMFENLRDKIEYKYNSASGVGGRKIYERRGRTSPNAGKILHLHQTNPKLTIEQSRKISDKFFKKVAAHNEKFGIKERQARNQVFKGMDRSILRKVTKPSNRIIRRMGTAGGIGGAVAGGALAYGGARAIRKLKERGKK
jgi:hypothetical protein